MGEIKVVLYRAITGPENLWKIWEGRNNKPHGWYAAPNWESVRRWAIMLRKTHVATLEITGRGLQVPVFGAPCGTYAYEFIKLCRYKQGNLYEIYRWLAPMNGEFGGMIHLQEIIVPPKHLETVKKHSRLVDVVTLSLNTPQGG